MAVAGGTVNKLLTLMRLNLLILQTMQTKFSQHACNIQAVNLGRHSERAACLSIQQDLRATEIWGRQLKAPHR